MRRPRLLTRLFQPEEIDYCRSKPASQYAHFAGRFAAKEAVAKALGTSLAWHEVVISQEQSGKPLVRLSARAVEAARGGSVMLSISHSRDYAVAYAAFVSEQEGEPDR